MASSACKSSALSIKVKLEITKHFKGNKRTCTISSATNRDNTENVREIPVALTPSNTAKSRRPEEVEAMEKLLSIQVKDQNEKIRNLSHKMKVLSTYKDLKYKSLNPAEMVP